MLSTSVHLPFSRYRWCSVMIGDLPVRSASFSFSKIWLLWCIFGPTFETTQTLSQYTYLTPLISSPISLITPQFSFLLETKTLAKLCLPQLLWKDGSHTRQPQTLPLPLAVWSGLTCPSQPAAQNRCSSRLPTQRCKFGLLELFYWLIWLRYQLLIRVAFNNSFVQLTPSHLPFSFSLWNSNPIDWKMLMPVYQEMFPCTFPYVPGFDASGVVVAVS